MTSAKETVRLKRAATWISPPLGPSVLFVTRYGSHQHHLGFVTKQEPAPLFGSLSGWPSVFRGYLPLDILFAAVLTWSLMRLMVAGIIKIPSTPDEERLQAYEPFNPLKFMLGAVAAFMTLPGVMAVVFNGWFCGVVTYVQWYLIAVAFVLAVWGLCWLVWRMFRGARPQLGTAWRVCTLKLAVLGRGPWMMPARRVAAHFRADDVPDDRPRVRA